MAKQTKKNNGKPPKKNAPKGKAKPEAEGTDKKPTQDIVADSLAERKASLEKVLNEQQKAFCREYAGNEWFGNGVQAYCEAYKLDRRDLKDYNTAKSAAARLLTNDNILSYIDLLIEEMGLNDQNVDKELAFLIKQKADLNTKLGAISEYNKLKGRILKKLDVTSGGKTLAPNYDNLTTAEKAQLYRLLKKSQGNPEDEQPAGTGN